jgi:hypothetical protein
MARKYEHSTIDNRRIERFRKPAHAGGLCQYIMDYGFENDPHLAKVAAAQFYGILLGNFIEDLPTAAYLDVRGFATEKRIRIANEVIALLEKELANDRQN